LAVCEDATTPTFATIIAAYRERCPNVALDLFEMPSAMQASALRRGDIDAGLLPPPVQGTGIQCEELWREDWLVVMPTGHRLKRLSVVETADLAHENFITAHPEFGPGCHHQTHEMFLSAGIAPPIVAYAFRRLTMTMLVQSGTGVTLVPGAFAGSAARARSAAHDHGEDPARIGPAAVVGFGGAEGGISAGHVAVFSSLPSRLQRHTAAISHKR